jgi:predicted RNA-binding Zn-ribbon protein involved in translation (DUF1610 family)
MEIQCPGDDVRSLDSELYECPACSAEIEIFSNEERVKCYNCGNMVRRQQG